MAATLNHAALGQIKGLKPASFPEVDQYLGIQYATLTDAFARGKLVEKPQGPIEATKTGPLPVADPKNCDNEHLLFQHALPHPDYDFSPTECLTLNVSVPSKAAAAGPVPVLVLIHGGGFATGSANWPQYDLANIVARSEKLGQPIIAVGINYRLGTFGFLTSSALQEAGYKANNGLDDQRLGLEWVNKHIAGFGGDPTNITFIGSSAGGASGFHHLQSSTPLFTRLIALGGSPLIQPFPPQLAEIAFSIVTGTLGLGALPPAEQVKALLALPPQDIVAKLTGLPVPLGAIVDGEIVKAVPTYAGLADAAASLDTALFPGAKWCKTILVTDAEWDGMVIPVGGGAAFLKQTLEQVFADAPAVAATVVEGYGIDAASDDDKKVVTKFINDIGFGLPAKVTAQAWAAAGDRLGTKAYLAHLNAPNPWDGPWKGHTTHALDCVLVLGTYNEFLGAGQRAVAEAFAADVIAFANGKEPFPAYSGKPDAVSKVYYAPVDGQKDESVLAKEADESATKRRGVLEKAAGGNPALLDKLQTLFPILLQGPPK